MAGKTIKIPLYEPDLTGNEKKYVLDCVESGWISSLGEYVKKFEDAVAEFTGAKYAVSICNGTAALHTALLALGIGAGDEVIVPTLTYIASVNAVTYTGARAVFCDSLKEDWNINPEEIKKKITKKTKAILPVHLYGFPCNMDAITDIAEEYGLKVVEDCAEAFGTKTGGKHAGTFGNIGMFSFFGNKTITTGEGGMLITSDEKLFNNIKMIKGQGQSFTKRYWHEIIGYNYRMTNIQAAIGLAQIERIDKILQRKHEIASAYRELLKGAGVEFQKTKPGNTPSDWLISVLLPENADRDKTIGVMAEMGVDTRPVFYCASALPMYLNESNEERFHAAENISARGISLPSYPALKDEDVKTAADSLKKAISRG